ncbi:MAG: DNA-protecting protein DprA [Acidobacteria bacterium]|nr:DNA-protecting protein DprA [Acidobacteriota bacterium]
MRLLRETGSLGNLLALSMDSAVRLTGETEELLAPLLEPPETDATRKARELLRAADARAVVLGDEEYPALLAEIPDPPPVLFLRGRALGDEPAVALVGSRAATAVGLETARFLSRGLAEAGVNVVSGFARGIDTAAHEAALDAGGPTVAVFACGVDVCYPRSNAALLRRLLPHGTAVSEHVPGTEPQPFHFPVRNRIIAGLSSLVVVVEAAEKSGSLITARLANEYGRDVGAVPGPVLTPAFAGANALLKDGAILVRSAADILAELPGALQGTPTQASLPLLSAEASSVHDALDAVRGTDADALLAATRLSPSRLASALAELELEGLVTALPGGTFLRRG